MISPADFVNMMLAGGRALDLGLTYSDLRWLIFSEIKEVLEIVRYSLWKSLSWWNKLRLAQSSLACHHWSLLEEVLARPTSHHHLILLLVLSSHQVLTKFLCSIYILLTKVLLSIIHDVLLIVIACSIVIGLANQYILRLILLLLASISHIIAAPAWDVLLGVVVIMIIFWLISSIRSSSCRFVLFKCWHVAAPELVQEADIYWREGWDE